MSLCLLLLVAVVSLFFWLYQVNKDYYVLSFFAPRVRTKDGRPVESIVPVGKGKTIFGNCFDLLMLVPAESFEIVRQRSRKFQSSYILYKFSTAIFNIIDAENAELVLNDQNLITKGVTYSFLHPALQTGLLTSTGKQKSYIDLHVIIKYYNFVTGKKWHSRRKMLTPTFHFNILGQFEEIFKTESLKFVKQFEGQSDINISLSELIPRFTLNSICGKLGLKTILQYNYTVLLCSTETAMGVKLDDMAEKGDRYRQNFAMVEQTFIKRINNPFFWNDTIYKYFGDNNDALALKAVHDFSSEIIAKRRILLKDEQQQRKNKQRFAMLDTLIMAEKDGLIDHQGICEEVDTLMFGGFDTTSMAITFGLMNMSLHADKQELCYQEINDCIDDDLSNLNINQIAKLQYLDCVIRETLRMFPSAPVIGRNASKETQLANGLILPAGSQVVVHVFDIHRNTKYWDAPNEFQPERFLPENSKDRHIYSYIPFSAGQRNCIGQKYGMLEMKTFFIIVLKQFKILPLVDPKDFVFNTGITLRTNNNIKVKLVKRKL
ncbi:hypothetical protein KR093_002761 [Drosophila rubida]|uniref:Cytochrome P450 4p1 n=1 Tax=Drosophila rubida TaxID=30044 RepID=A0AAD4PJQ5_9MUSC|nr:hypothetical protein KR093_002761 [Drosophila rubida]